MSETVHHRSLFERHLQTGLLTILVGLCGWLGVTTNNTQVRLAELNATMTATQSQVTRLERATDDLYTETEAARDREAINKRIGDLERRVLELERDS